MKLADELRSTHNQDGAIALDIRAGLMFRMNPVGSRIFELLRSGKSEPEIVEFVTQEFSAERSTVADDVREFLARLEQHRLVRS